MRRISILILTAMLLTISGVYATWNYAQGNVATQDTFLLPSMTDKVIETAKGTISIDKTNATIIIDDATNDHVAEVTYGGEIVITFTPAVGADPDVILEGIDLCYSVTTTPDWKYPETGDSHQIFTVTNTSSVVLEKENFTKNENGSFSIMVATSDIGQMLSFYEFTLSNVASYDAFRTVLNRGNIKVTVQEYIEATPLPSGN